MSTVYKVNVNGTLYGLGDQSAETGLGKLNGNGIDTIIKLTQAEYDAIQNKSATTLYIIIEE